MNLKQRLKNETFVAAMLAAIVTFVYQVLGVIGVVAPISQDEVMQVIGIILNLLVGLGVFVDPTTRGITDGKKCD